MFWKKEFTYQFFIGECGFSTGIKRKDILFLKVGIAQVCVAGNDGFEDLLCIGLPEDL